MSKERKVRQPKRVELFVAAEIAEVMEEMARRANTAFDIYWGLQVAVTVGSIAPDDLAARLLPQGQYERDAAATPAP